MVTRIALLTLLTVLCGCGKAPGARPGNVTLLSGETAQVEWNGGHAKSITTKAGDVTPFSRGEVVLSDQIVVQTADGRLEVHRFPNEIMKEMQLLPHLYMKDGTQEERFVRGHGPLVYIDPDDHALYWLAHMCTNPGCESQSMGTSERPYVFSYPLPGLSVDPDGKLVYSGIEIRPPKRVPCPICGSPATKYVPSEAASLKGELAEELQHVRDARRNAEQISAEGSAP